MRVLFLSLVSLVFGTGQVAIADDAEAELLSAIVDFSISADEFLDDVRGQVSYERSHIPAERLANAVFALSMAVNEGAECFQIKVRVKSIKHRFNTLKNGFNSDQETWGIPIMAESFTRLAESFASFSTATANYINTRVCDRDRFTPR